MPMKKIEPMSQCVNGKNAVVSFSLRAFPVMSGNVLNFCLVSIQARYDLNRVVFVDHMRENS